MLDVLQGKGSKVYSIYMDFGTALHETIEVFRPGKKIPQRDIDKFPKKEPRPDEEKPEEVDKAVYDTPQKYFQRKFENLYAFSMRFYRQKELALDVEEFIAAGIRIIDHLDDLKELAEAEVFFNEFPLYEPIERTDDVKMMFKGYVDLVIKTKSKRGKDIIYICDFKTCSWGWDLKKKQDPKVHAQLMLYKHFFCKRFDLDPESVRTAFILLKRRPKKGDIPLEFLPISAGPVSVQRSLNVLNETVTEMTERQKDGSFVKNRKACKNAFGDVCPHLGTPNCPEGS